MNLKWLKLKRSRANAPKLTAIYIAPGAGEPMQLLRSATAVQDRGLQGDRYYENTGHWKLLDGCQVTLITEHELEQAAKRSKINLDDGSHRRNLVIEGIKLKVLQDKHFKIGDAVFAYDKPRPPCGYIDGVSCPGMGRALSHNSGICIRVLQTGVLNVDDPIEILTE